MRPAGWISKVGWGPQPLNFSLDPLVQKNVTLQGSFSHNWPIWERVIALLAAGSLDVRPIIGGVWAIEQWHEAFEKMHAGEVVKSVQKEACSPRACPREASVADRTPGDYPTCVPESTRLFPKLETLVNA